jgi:hypothetical protein
MSKFFPEISDILNRYKTLKDANNYLIEKHHSDEAANDNLQREYLTFKKFKENQVLNDSNEIADMQLTLEQGKSRTNRVQAEIEKVAMEASEKSLGLGQIISSVANILDRCEESFRVRHNKPHVDRAVDRMHELPLIEQYHKTVSKLEEVSMFIVDFKDIISDYDLMLFHESTDGAIPNAVSTPTNKLKYVQGSENIQNIIGKISNNFDLNGESKSKTDSKSVE